MLLGLSLVPILLQVMLVGVSIRTLKLFLYRKWSVGSHLVCNKCGGLWICNCGHETSKANIPNSSLDSFRFRFLCWSYSDYYSFHQSMDSFVSMPIIFIPILLLFFRAIIILIIAGVTAYYALGLKTVYDDFLEPGSTASGNDTVSKPPIVNPV